MKKQNVKKTGPKIPFRNDEMLVNQNSSEINGLAIDANSTIQRSELAVKQVKVEVQNQELVISKLNQEDLSNTKDLQLFREITWEILKIINESENLNDSIQLILAILKDKLGVTLIGLRFQEGNDFPYFAYSGFPDDFIKQSNSLLTYDNQGQLCTDQIGNPCYACFCGMVISGKTKIPNTNNSPGGSWWTNDSIAALNDLSEISSVCYANNNCIRKGYSSIALIPIRDKGKVVGILQFNDFNKDRFNHNLIKNVEGIASHIGVSLLRKKAEDALRESEELLRKITENAPNIILELDITGKILYISRVLPGYSKADVIGKNFCDWTLPEYHETMKNALAEVFKTAQPQSYRTKGFGLDGEIRWYQADISSLTNSGKVTNAILVTIDITEQILAERRRLGILQTTTDGFLLLDKVGHLLEVNETYCRMSGYTKEELLKMNISNLDDSETKEDVLAHIQKIISVGEDRFESRHRRKDGSTIEIEINTQYQDIDGGRFIVFIHDITKRKLREEKLRLSELRYKSLFQKNLSVILLIDPVTGEIKDANPVACKYYGWNHSEICTKNIFEINMLSAEEIKIGLKNSICEEQNHFYFRHRIASGEIRDVEVYSGPIEFDQKKLLYSIIHDITDRKIVENALLENELKFRKYIDFAPHGIFAANQNAEYVEVNSAACDISGYTRGELLSMKLFELVPHDAQEIAADHFKQVVEIGFASLEMPFLKKDQSVGYWSVDAVKLSDNLYLGFVIDISARIKSEADLKENERLILVSQAAANIGSYSLDLRTRSWKASPEIYRIFGIDQEYPNTIDAWVNRIHPDFKNKLYEDLNLGKTEDKRFEHEYKIIRVGDGIERWVHGLGEFEYDENYSPIRLVGTIQDITDRKNAEEVIRRLNEELEERVESRTVELLKSNAALKLAEEKYKTVADFTHDWEYWMNEDGHYDYVSPSCERVSGYTAEEFQKNPGLLLEIVFPEDLHVFQMQSQHVEKANDCHYELQFRIVKSNGSMRWIKHIWRNIFDDSGTFSGIRGNFQDISGRKSMEDLLKTSNQKYKLLSENITDGIFIIKDGCFEYVNKAMSRIFGYSESDLLGMRLTELVKPEYLEDLEIFHSIKIQVNRSRNFESECLKENKASINVEFMLNYVAKEKVIYGVAHDITEKKQIQKDIVKAIIQTEEKERSYFSKELHDGLGPLLSTIKLYLQWSERPKSIKLRDEIIHKAEDIVEESLTAVKEISNKLSPHLLTNYGLSSALRSFVDKIRKTSAIRIEFESNLSRRLDTEFEAALYRGVIECINNSLKHSKSKNITILILDSGKQIQIEYKDDGIGFNMKETLSSQKGLGLFNLQNRIRTIGGNIFMFSKPKHGVNYQIVLNA